MGNNTTEEDLKAMGLVETSPGTWVPKSVAKKVEKIKAKEAKKYQGNPKEVSIDGPPTYYEIKDKRYYLTANVLLSHDHWIVRNTIVAWAKKFLTERMLHLKALEPRSILLVVFSTTRKIGPLTRYDVDNRGYFWGKMFQDALEDLGTVKVDNAYWITEVRYKFDWKRKEDNLTFKIL